MNKLAFLLFMPFFMACGGYKAHENSVTKAQLEQWRQQKKIDSLVLYGSRYRWHTDKDINGLSDYVTTNFNIAEDFFSPQYNNLSYHDKEYYAAPFYANITALEKELAKNTAVYGQILAKALFRWADYHFKYSYNDSIVSAYKRCLLYYNQFGGLKKSHVVRAYKNLGISYNILGEKEKVLKYYNQAYDTASANNMPEEIGSTIINKLIFLNEYKDYDAAIRLARLADTLQGLALKRKATAQALCAQALYATGNDSYHQHLQTAWGLLEQIPPQEADEDILDRRRDVLAIWGQTELTNQRYDKALQYFQQALDTCTKRNKGSNHERYYAKLLLKMAALQDSLGHTDNALHYCQWALSCVCRTDSARLSSNPLPGEVYAENAIMEALDAKAAILRKKYTVTKDTALLTNAIACYEAAFATERKLLDNFSYDNSRLEMQKISKQRSEAAIAACYMLYTLSRNSAWAEKAFAFSENSKAFVLLVAIRQNISRSSRQNDPLQKKADSLRLQLAYAEKKVREALMTGTQPDEQLTVQRAQLETALNDATITLEQNSKLFRQLQRIETTDLLQVTRTRLLTSRRSLAEYFSSGNQHYLFLLPQSGPIQFVQLDSGLHHTADSMLTFFTAPGIIEASINTFYQQAAKAWKDCGLGKLPASVTELILIPDGQLSLLPFEALLTDSTGPSTGLGKAPYLLKRFALSYGFSAASLLAQADKLVAANHDIAAFAPGFMSSPRNLPPLPETLKEVDSISGTVTQYRDEQATLEHFRQCISTAAIIHLASHAAADTGIDPQPRLELYDSAFYLKELYARHINANLVVLNACETNRGVIDKSEGPLSLARGFYYAGARHIIASMWKVDDRSTASITKFFYQQATDGNFAAALQQAKLTYLHNNTGNTSPYYWATLVHIGTPAIPPGDGTAQWAYLAVFAAAILLLWYLLRKQKR